jgi:hypothetical protein
MRAPLGWVNERASRSLLLLLLLLLLRPLFPTSVAPHKIRSTIMSMSMKKNAGRWRLV